MVLSGDGSVFDGDGSAGDGAAGGGEARAGSAYDRAGPLGHLGEVDPVQAASGALLPGKLSPLSPMPDGERGLVLRVGAPAGAGRGPRLSPLAALSLVRARALRAVLGGELRAAAAAARRLGGRHPRAYGRSGLGDPRALRLLDLGPLSVEVDEVADAVGVLQLVGGVLLLLPFGLGEFVPQPVPLDARFDDDAAVLLLPLLGPFGSGECVVHGVGRSVDGADHAAHQLQVAGARPPPRGPPSRIGGAGGVVP